MIDNFISKLEKELLKGLPGKSAQERMSPTVRFTGFMLPDKTKAKSSGVLILLYPKNSGVATVFIERTAFGPHGGQISLPGGKKEKNDSSLIATALRETSEELGIDVSSIHVLGELSSLYVPNSNFNIFPVVAYQDIIPKMSKEDKEVKSIIEIGLSELFHPDNKGVKSFIKSGYNIEAPYYNANGHVIWGATAMIMSELEVVLNKNGILS